MVRGGELGEKDRENKRERESKLAPGSYEKVCIFFIQTFFTIKFEF